jgi:hypothetical protein
LIFEIVVVEPGALMSELTAVASQPASPKGLKPVLLRFAESPLLLAVTAYLLSTLILLPSHMAFYYKDEVVYVAAAERYAAGDFAHAPNSLWGPLISWLMAVPLALGASAIVAARVVPILIGIVTLWAVRRLARTLSLSDGLQVVLLLTLVPYLLYFSIIGASDDLPLTLLLVVYFSIIFDPRYPGMRYTGAVCGLLGAFCYFAKGFGLGFFLIHFTMSSLLHWLANSEAKLRRHVIRHFGAGLLVFATLASLWVAALHQKYGVLTFGITGEYNHQIRGPDAKDRPALQIGFVAPPEGTTVSIWEDPAYYYDLPQARECCLKHWSAFDSGSAFKHQLLLFKLNLGRALMTFIGYSPFTLFVGFAGLAYCFAPFWPGNRRKKAPVGAGWRKRVSFEAEQLGYALDKKQRLTPMLMLFTLLLYPLPYTLVFSDERFYWPVLIVVMAFGLYLLQIFFSTYGISRTGRGWLIGLFAASFLLFPTYRLTTGNKARAALASISQRVDHKQFAGAPIASQNDFGASMVVAYYAHAKYYGSAAPGMSDEAILQDLRRKGVQYYFVWDLPVIDRPGMTLSRVLKADFRSLAIYSIDPLPKETDGRARGA